MKLKRLMLLALLVWLCGPSDLLAQQPSVTISNTSRSVGDGRWDWTVFVIAPAPILGQIQCVEYTLHPTFPNPVRRVCVQGKDPRAAFPLSSNGWGEFTIGIRIFFRNGKTQRLEYPLKLTAH